MFSRKAEPFSRSHRADNTLADRIFDDELIITRDKQPARHAGHTRKTGDDRQFTSPFRFSLPRIVLDTAFVLERADAVPDHGAQRRRHQSETDVMSENPHPDEDKRTDKDDEECQNHTDILPYAYR